MDTATASKNPPAFSTADRRLPWAEIDTVLFDMDGTLLDLHFDNRYWRELIPDEYARLHGHEPELARQRLLAEMERTHGQLQWYCLDHWVRFTGLDLLALKARLERYIAFHPYALDVLDTLRVQGKRLLLVTNAHPEVFAFKHSRTGLGDHLHRVVSAHALDCAKEEGCFWERLQTVERYDPQRTLLVDDNLAALASARAAGVQHLRGVRYPDSRGPAMQSADFHLLENLAELLPDRLLHAYGSAPV
ncbi:HAD-superfamily hydrolase, subfamily IA, variant 3 [Thioalkalivibrio nitratireducens DSM 14787]|uniref:HAD-superfamily hydrolase, subfamily IA, variant 3 n=1 Tax=Thioalkalivibrio nitratireducens (strain DSM 14787 / UNIQEM 213 / ALEN2) TaxID=1255043 RepID=L0DSN0_THIND|nr:HAD-IA family hydrolase [Thioalkalivibrio nitratireducens]AGA32002.1 HAD-superfamily hydrolase, subfamily IA, variant 3 [Thioalkalivibrio nitratireducens DSM 14787]